MIGATELDLELKLYHPHIHICFVGSHISALPREVISLPYVDTILLNEGVYALHSLLASDLQSDLSSIKGIAWKDDSGNCVLNDPEQIVPQD